MLQPPFKSEAMHKLEDNTHGIGVSSFAIQNVPWLKSNLTNKIDYMRLQPKGKIRSVLIFITPCSLVLSFQELAKGQSSKQVFLGNVKGLINPHLLS